MIRALPRGLVGDRENNRARQAAPPTKIYMTYNPDIHHRRSIRLREYYYSATGAYFVTICVQGRECLLGEITDYEMRLNDSGRMVEAVWKGLPERFTQVELDEYMIMPNHFHGIIVITDDADLVGAGSPRPKSTGIQEQGGETPPLRAPSLGQIVGYFKYQSTKQVNMMRDNPGVPVWQRNYYERVIRNEVELNAARKYIVENPMKWAEDKENPGNTHP